MSILGTFKENDMPRKPAKTVPAPAPRAPSFTRTQYILQRIERTEEKARETLAKFAEAVAADVVSAVYPSRFEAALEARAQLQAASDVRRSLEANGLAGAERDILRRVASIASGGGWSSSHVDNAYSGHSNRAVVRLWEEVSGILEASDASFLPEAGEELPRVEAALRAALAAGTNATVNGLAVTSGYTFEEAQAAAQKAAK